MAASPLTYLAKAERREKGLVDHGRTIDVASLSPPPPKRFIEILEFVSQILGETSCVRYLRYEISFFLQRGRGEGKKKNVFPGGEL